MGATGTDLARTLDGGTVDVSVGQIGPGKGPLPYHDAREPLSGWQGREGLDRAITDLLVRGLPEAAIRIFALAENQGVTSSWATCYPMATALLQVGRPARGTPGLGVRGPASFASDTINPARRQRPGALELPAAERVYLRCP